MTSKPETFSFTLSREFALLCSMDGTVHWADQRATHALGVEEGDSLEDFIFADSREKLGWLLIHAGQKKATGWEISFLSQGNPVVYECTGAPYRGDIMLVASMLPANHQAVIDDMIGTMGELSRLQRESLQQQHELEQLSARLDRERLLLLGVLSQLPSGVRVIDSRTHQVILANDQFYTLLGTEAPEGTSAELAIDMQFPDGRPCEPDQLPIARTLGTGKPINSEEIRLTRKDGSNRIIYVSTAPVRNQDDEFIAAVEILHDVTDLKHLQEKFEHDSLHDALTSLPNRRFFLERLAQAMASATRRGTQLAILFLDLDGFKQINDQLGHIAGDLALRETAARLRSVIRSRDTVARFAGDEFLILLEDVGDATGAITMTERLLAAFAEPLYAGTDQVQLSFSIGIVVSDGGDLSPEALIDRADKAMYQAKNMGKNKHYIFRDEQPGA